MAIGNDNKSLLSITNFDPQISLLAIASLISDVCLAISPRIEIIVVLDFSSDAGDQERSTAVAAFKRLTSSSADPSFSKF